jgi:hypothetical protein
MLGGGRLIDNLSEDDIRTELEKLKSDEITDDMIKNTINQLKKKNNWKEYSPIDAINTIIVQDIIKNLEKNNSNNSNNSNNTANPASWFNL